MDDLSPKPKTYQELMHELEESKARIRALEHDLLVTKAELTGAERIALKLSEKFSLLKEEHKLLLKRCYPVQLKEEIQEIQSPDDL